MRQLHALFRTILTVRVLDGEADAELIANYSDPTFILNGWTPEVK